MTARNLRRLLALILAWAWLAPPGCESYGFKAMTPDGLKTAIPVIPAPIPALGGPGIAPILVPTPLCEGPAPRLDLAAPAAPVPEPVAEPVFEVILPAAAEPAEQKPLRQGRGVLKKIRDALDGIIHPKKPGVEQSRAANQTVFDGARPPDTQPPTAILPDGSAVKPDLFLGGYHGTDAITPDMVRRGGGLPTRGPHEDRRLLEHAEPMDKAGDTQVSAFRGATPFATSPDGETGASYWAGVGGWVYEVDGVPIWDVNAKLEGRVRNPDGSYRGNRMSGENEYAFPAHVPIECIKRWGQVQEGVSGVLYVGHDAWTMNTGYDPARCRSYWGRAAP